MNDLVIGGAGIFGLTIAELATRRGYKVLIIEKSNKIGGNVSSHFDERTGIEVHTYGPHIFHTNNTEVWEYINKFSQFIPYVHRVRTVTPTGSVLPLPFNLATFSYFFGKVFNPTEMRNLIMTFPKNNGNTFEEVAIASVGIDIYKEVIEGYTKKQWGRDLKDLPSSIIKRIPIRYTWDDNYFNDKYQGLPKNGYQEMLEKMAAHPNIEIQFNSDALYQQHNIHNTPFVYTGNMDRYFNYKHGELGWRAVDFVTEYPDTDDYQGCPQINYADESIPYTRIHEYKHYRPDKTYKGTVIHKEYARDTQMNDFGAYPINSLQDQETLHKYRKEINTLDGIWFGGRLGSYKYMDMHVAIASAITLWNNAVKPYLEKS